MLAPVATRLLLARERALGQVGRRLRLPRSASAPRGSRCPRRLDERDRAPPACGCWRRARRSRAASTSRRGAMSRVVEPGDDRARPGPRRPRRTAPRARARSPRCAAPAPRPRRSPCSASGRASRRSPPHGDAEDGDDGDDDQDLAWHRAHLSPRARRAAGRSAAAARRGACAPGRGRSRASARCVARIASASSTSSLVARPASNCCSRMRRFSSACPTAASAVASAVSRSSAARWVARTAASSSRSSSSMRDPVAVGRDARPRRSAASRRVSVPRSQVKPTKPDPTSCGCTMSERRVVDGAAARDARQTAAGERARRRLEPLLLLDQRGERRVVRVGLAERVVDRGQRRQRRARRRRASARSPGGRCAWLSDQRARSIARSCCTQLLLARCARDLHHEELVLGEPAVVEPAARRRRAAGAVRGASARSTSRRLAPRAGRSRRAPRAPAAPSVVAHCARALAAIAGLRRGERVGDLAREVDRHGDGAVQRAPPPPRE